MKKAATFHSTRISSVLFVLLAIPTMSPAATIDVNTEADVVANDGRCSLREAITSANRQRRSGTRAGECVAGQPLPTVDQIRIPKGQFRLTRGAPGDDVNASGDLDVTESVLISGAGRDDTVIRNRIGSPQVVGDGDRLVHVDPRALGGVDVTLRRLTLADGDVGCTGAFCKTGASAVDASGNGALALRSIRVIRNTATCTGESCGDPTDGGAIRAAGGGSLTIRRAVIRSNRSSCFAKDCLTGAAAIYMDTSNGALEAKFLLEGSVLDDNQAQCVGEKCRTGMTVEVVAGSVLLKKNLLSRNGAACKGATCEAGDTLRFTADKRAHFEEVDLLENFATCEGTSCQAWFLFRAVGERLTSLNLLAAQNETLCKEADCRAREQLAFYGDEIGLDGFLANTNSNTCEGDYCIAENVVDLSGTGPAAIRDGILSNNGTACRGKACGANGVVRFNVRDAFLERTLVTGSFLVGTGERSLIGSALDLRGRDLVTVHGSNIVDTTGFCEGVNCGTDALVQFYTTDGDVRIDESALESNELSCKGDNCFTSEVMNSSAGGTGIFLNKVGLTFNSAQCTGASCRIGEIGQLIGSQGLVSEWLVTNNLTKCTGANCRGEAIAVMHVSEGAIGASTFASNRAECDGTSFAPPLGGALHNTGELLIVDSDFVGNRTDGWGAGIFNDPGDELSLESVTVKENLAGMRGNNDFAAGGGIYNDAAGSAKGVLRLKDSVVQSNQASFTGGGIGNEGTIAAITDSTLINNTPGDCVNINGSGCP